MHLSLPLAMQLSESIYLSFSDLVKVFGKCFFAIRCYYVFFSNKSRSTVSLISNKISTEITFTTYLNFVSNNINTISLLLIDIS